jgi:prepilin-type N-terminal cleavage/methylation domain-containing protein/prepilin-type processing-associated H-X9-DG protein
MNSLSPPVRASRAKAGFTLIELLVVITIISVLVSLLLPAANAAREAARRMTCTNKLRQMAIAMNNYHSSRGRLPFGTEPIPGTSPTRYYGVSPQAQLLPYFEEEQLFQLVDFEASYNAPENAAALMTPVDLLRCPSDIDRLPVNLGARNNYYANAGSDLVFTPPDKSNTTDPNRDMPAPSGLFYRGSRIKFSQIRDGLSHTAAFCEKMTGDGNPAIASEQTDTFRPGTYPSTPDEAVQMCQDTDIHDLANQGVSEVGAPWIYAYHSTTLYYHINTPNRRSCMFPPGRIMTTANSQHSGGVNVAMCDASVRFVTDDVDLAVWRAAGTRRGNERQRLDE